MVTVSESICYPLLCNLLQTPQNRAASPRDYGDSWIRWRDIALFDHESLKASLALPGQILKNGELKKESRGIKPMKKLIAMLVLVAGASILTADDNSLPVMTKHVKTSGEFTVAVAEQMPDADYSYKLTPPQMSFAEQIAHIANSNNYFCATLAGDKPSSGKPASMGKADVIAFLKKSNGYCLQVVSKATTAQLNKAYKAEDGEMTGTELITILLDHTTHHRAQAEMYLRSKGITPTQYRY